MRIVIIVSPHHSISQHKNRAPHKAGRFFYFEGVLYVIALSESLTPSVVGSTTIPRITNTANSASTTSSSLLPSSPRSKLYPNSEATAWISNSYAGIRDTQNCLFTIRTFQLIMFLTSTQKVVLFLPFGVQPKDVFILSVEHTILIPRFLQQAFIFSMLRYDMLILVLRMFDPISAWVSEV